MMARNSFTRRWGALILVVVLAAGAVAFIGKDGVARAVAGEKSAESNDLAARQAASNIGAAPVVARTPTDNSTVVEWSDDDDLIDDTAGIDPTPPDAMTDDEGTVIDGQSPAAMPDASVALAPDGANLPSDGGNF